MEALVITPEIEAAAQRLAERTGKTPAEAVADALERELNGAIPKPPRDMKKIREILARIHAGPIDYGVTEDEILGYDDFGVPEQPYLDR